MSPSVTSFFTAILRQLQTNRLVRAKISPEAFRVGQSAENEYPFLQTFGNPSPRIVEPFLLTVAVNKQNHKSVGITIHFNNMV